MNGLYLDEFTIRGCTCGLNLLSVLLTFIQWYPAIKPLQLWENFSGNLELRQTIGTVAAVENSDILTTPNFWLCKWY
jgi:hypothetical protein